MSKIIILTGPPGAGKSTTSEAFAKKAKGTWAYICQDDIRHDIKSGFSNPTKTWTKETHNQWELSQYICGDLLKRYNEYEVNCILDCFAPKDTFDKWQKALEGISYKMVVLLPHVDTVVKRDNQRQGEAVMKEPRVREHHEWFSAWKGDDRATIIDNTNMSIDEVVKHIEKLVS